MPKARGCKRFGARVLLVFLLWTSELDLTELAAQDVPTNPDVIELLLAGDFEELGGSDSALADVAVVLKAIEQYGCIANPPDREAALAVFRVLLRNPDLSVTLATAAAHPAWSRFVAWVAVLHPEDCNDPRLQQLIRGAARYFVLIDSGVIGPPTEEEILADLDMEALREQDRSAWWADLETLRARDPVRDPSVRSTSYADKASIPEILNMDELRRDFWSLREALLGASYGVGGTLRLNVLVDATGRVVESRPQGTTGRIEQVYSAAESLALRMKLAPARTCAGVEVPLWINLLIDSRRERPEITLSANLWWRYRVTEDGYQQLQDVNERMWTPPAGQRLVRHDGSCAAMGK